MNSMLGERFVAYAWRPRNQRRSQSFTAEGAYNNVADAPVGKVLVGVSAVDDGIIGNYDVKAWEGVSLTGYRLNRQTLCGGLRFSDDAAAFVSYTLYCLDLLSCCDVGRTLLDKLALEGQRQQRVVVIALSPLGANQYIVSNHNSRSAVSSAVLQGGNPLPDVITQAVVRQGGPGGPFNAVADWLHDQVLRQPIWTNHGSARVVPQYQRPGNTELRNACDQVWNCRPRELSQADFRQWLAAPGTAPLTAHVNGLGLGGDAQDLHEYLRMGMILTLYAGSPPGGGAHCMVQFAPGHGLGIGDQLADLRARLRRDRPPAIGLAHELIHAARALAGQQPDSSNTDVVLTEMACVGLGPWKDDLSFPTENHLRSRWCPAVSQKILYNWAPKDPVNLRRHATLRPHYSWDESSFLSRDVRPRPLTWSGSPSEGLKCVLCTTRTHGSRVSSVLGRWHLCKKCGNVFCNVCAKWKLARQQWLERTRVCTCGGKTTLVE